MITKEVIARILKRVTIDSEGCWLVSGWNDGKGYAKISVKGKSKFTHRVMFEWFNRRKIRKGLQIDHICCSRGCCNPLHLQAVTNKTNSKLRDKRKRKLIIKIEEIKSET